MTLREFTKECCKHGFIKKGKSLYRCIGDGIFQMLYIGGTERLRADHPLYSPNHHYERTISIYLKSIYSIFYNDEPIDTLTGYHISVYRLIGDYSNNSFDGESIEYELMCKQGFAILDKINTQYVLENFLYEMDNIDVDGPRYNFQNFDLLLYCNEYYKAKMSVTTLLSSNIFSLCEHYYDEKQLPTVLMQFDPRNPSMIRYTQNDEAIDDVEMKKYVLEKIDIVKYLNMYRLTYPKNRDKANERLEENKQKNINRLVALGLIPDCTSTWT